MTLAIGLLVAGVVLFFAWSWLRAQTRFDEFCADHRARVNRETEEALAQVYRDVWSKQGGMRPTGSDSDE